MKKSKQPDIKKILAPHRKRIDKIDDAILKLLAERFEIVKAVARIKIKHDFLIVQKSRVRQVIVRNAETALKYGINHRLVRRLYQDIIDEAHVIENRIKRERSR